MSLPTEITNNLQTIGNDVASTWGGSCTGYHVDNENKEVIFDCIEHGEEFSASVTFKELPYYLRMVQGDTSAHDELMELYTNDTLSVN